jgi:hypothetical protein
VGGGIPYNSNIFTAHSMICLLKDHPIQPVKKKNLGIKPEDQLHKMESFITDQPSKNWPACCYYCQNRQQMFADQTCTQLSRCARNNGRKTFCNVGASRAGMSRYLTNQHFCRQLCRTRNKGKKGKDVPVRNKVPRHEDLRGMEV